jgi:TonB family protein
MARLLLVALTLSASFLAVSSSPQTKPRDRQLARPGVNGVTNPACLYCPLPDYTDQARKAKLEGAVVIQAVVTVEGRAEHVSVVRGLGSGLDEKAIEVVQRWRFRPAHDSDGHPVAASVPMEVTFRLRWTWGSGQWPPL